MQYSCPTALILLLALLVCITSLASAFQLQRGNGGTDVPIFPCRTKLKVALNARRSKDELTSIAASVGLKTTGPNNAKSQNPKKKAKKRKPKSKQASVLSNTKEALPSSLPLQIGKPSVAAQLEYSRKGSTSLRSFLDPHLLRTIRSDLLAYTQERELDAWRQKVEVGSNDPERAKKCRTIQECKIELVKLNIFLDNLPFLQYFNTWRDIDNVEQLCYALGQSASILLDVPSVRLYQDALFTKRSNDGPTPWHTDARMAPFDTSNMLTFWIPLQPVPKDGTGLLFVPKSHNDFALPFWNDFDGSEYARLEERYKDDAVDYMPLQVGDVTVHSGWTLHCADGNASAENRYALAISFVDAQAEIRENALDFSPTQGGSYGDNEDQWSYQEWVRQVPTRETFGNHRLVPIVWPSP